MKPLPLGLLIAGGVISFAGPLVGLAVTIFSMSRAFYGLGQHGINNPAILSDHIGSALVSTWAGLILGTGIGFPIIVVGTVLAIFMQKPTKPIAAK